MSTQITHFAVAQPRVVHAGGNFRAEAMIFCLIITAIAFVTDSPGLMWFSAWIGSFVLLLLTLLGKVFTFPNDLPLREQALRPWVLLQSVFVGYNCLTSVFYWLDVNGYYFFDFQPNRVDQTNITLAALSQRYYFVGHVALVYGLALGMRYRPKVNYAWKRQKDLSRQLLRLSVIAAIAMVAISLVPGLSQFTEKLRALATVSAAASLGVAYREKDAGRLLFPTIANIGLLLWALTSGWKSEVLVIVLLNSSVFFSSLPKLTVLLTVTILTFGIGVLPPIAQKIREESWSGGGGRWESFVRAIDSISKRSLEETASSSWEFLTQRLSEVSLFTRYVNAVPQWHPFYEGQIIKQAIVTPIPRVIWSSKQDTEILVRQRVVELGAVEAHSSVSAKPQFIVDGYLTYGAIGVAVTMLFYGMVCSYASKLCESLLGGYLLGGVAFNGLFGILWTGNCFEFIFNGVFWSFVFVVVLFYLARGQGWLVRIPRLAT